MLTLDFIYVDTVCIKFISVAARNKKFTDRFDCTARTGVQDGGCAGEDAQDRSSARRRGGSSDIQKGDSKSVIYTVLY